MKTRTLLNASLALLALNFLGGQCYGQSYVPTPNEEIYGTWTNDKSINLIGFQKTVVTADGFQNYADTSDSVPREKGVSQIDTKWTDSEGNIWYKTFGTVTGVENRRTTKFQNLVKVSKSGTVMEIVHRHPRDFDSSNYPTKIDPDDNNYGIYYRTEK